jgi:hypothetical protein
MIGRTGTTRALSLISLAVLGAVVAPACGETDSDDDGVGGSAGGGGKATTSGGSKATTGGAATAKGGATSTGGISSAGGEAPSASGGKATAGSPGTGQGGETASDGGEPGFPGGGTTGQGGASGGDDCDGATPVDGEDCEGFGTVCDVGDEVCACLPAGQGSSSWTCTGTTLPGAGGSGGGLDCDSVTPVDGEDCDSNGTLCETDDGGVCACLGQNDPTWNCFGGEDTPGAGGAGTGFGGRQGAGGRNQGGRTGFGGRESFGQGGA